MPIFAPPPPARAPEIALFAQNASGSRMRRGPADEKSNMGVQSTMPDSIMTVPGPGRVGVSRAAAEGGQNHENHRI